MKPSSYVRAIPEIERLLATRGDVDVIFREIKLIIEIDGRLFHIGTEVFETDRSRQNKLVLDGWCVLRFTLRAATAPRPSFTRWDERAGSQRACASGPKTPP